MLKDHELPSRRDLVRWTAVASSCSLVAACSSDNGSPAVAPDVARTTDATTQAVSTLNRLLADEWEGIAAYGFGATVFASPPKGDPLAASAPVLLDVARHFLSQHAAHASALSRAIKALGGTPVPQPSGPFKVPAGFTGTVTNVLRLAANIERDAALAYNGAIARLPVPQDVRFLAGSILGDETQHFVVLYSLLTGVAVAGPNIATSVGQIVPTSFTSTVGAEPGLQSVADFAYG